MRFLDRLFGRRAPTSREIAKERLQLVLVHDRIRISPATLDKMKDELITVISRYVEIEAGSVQVTFTQGRRESRLVADIPVLGPAPKRAARREPSASARSGASGDG